MFRRKLMDSVTGGLAALEQNRSGNTAMIFALMAVPMFMVAGFALDFRRASNGKSEVQAAMDAAAISAARAYITSNESTIAARWADAKIAGASTFVSDMAGSATRISWSNLNFVSTQDNRVQVSVDMSTPTTFAGIMGLTEIKNKVEAEVAAGDDRPFEIVLVLDNTTSMFSGTRMEDMREAAKIFTEIMYESSS
ncbi:MAG: pilus assembly protein TadG-related protein, partial [Henriciella sp.]|nr:pilus assembly protein TadG-related protein [Henriciella sp.]